MSKTVGALTARVIDLRSTAHDAHVAAWLAAVPTAALVLLTLVVAGPALGGALFPAHALTTWQRPFDAPIDERTEHGRFLIALCAPLVLSALTVLLARRPERLRAPTARTLAAIAQGMAGVLVVVCAVAQRTYTFHFIGSAPHVVYFRLPTLVTAAAIAAALTAGVRAPRVRARFERLTVESRGRTGLAWLVALAVTAASLLIAVETDATVGQAHPLVTYHLPFTYDETMAVLDGRSPLGDFAAQYASLWPYAIAAPMALVGDSVGTFTTLLAILSGVSLLALFDVLRRLTRRSTVALLLFLPLLATSLFTLQTAGTARFSLANYYGTMPLRYAGPFLLAWLTARALDTSVRWRAWPVFLVGGLVAINNAELGIAALGASTAAMLWTTDRGWRSLASLGMQAAIGLAVASALVSVLLLARTGSMPQLELAFRYAHLFAIAGFAMIPMRPVLGMSTIIYLTYVCAIGVATVREVSNERDRLLTGMLVWSGVFGLGAGAYYMGRSSPEVLVNMFPAWALAVVVLTVAVLRQLGAAARARPTLAQLACLFGFGILVCSLAQTPAPWRELDRVSQPRTARTIFDTPLGEQLVASTTRSGEAVAILTPLGHKTAVNVGVDDVDPYTGPGSIQAEEQLDDVLRALRDAGGTKVYVSLQSTLPGLVRSLRRRGFAPQVEDQEGTQLWERRPPGDSRRR